MRHRARLWRFACWQRLERWAGRLHLACQRRRVRADVGTLAHRVLREGERTAVNAAIREWRPTDAAPLRAMIGDFLREAGQHGEPTPATPEMVDGFFLLGLDADAVALVAFRDDRPVGFVLCTVDAGVRGLVYTFVAPSDRRQGIARQMRRQAFELAAQRGVQTLFTLAYDGPWIKFEQRDGFRPLALLLRRDLPAPTVTATSTAATRVNMNRLGLSLN